MGSQGLRGTIAFSSIFLVTVFVCAPTSLARDRHTSRKPAKTSASGSGSLPKCTAYSSAGFRGKKCLVKVDRDNPSSPPTLLLPGGTTVEIEVTHPRWNESVSFTAATTETTPPDIALAALKNLLPSLQSIVVSKTTTGFTVKVSKPVVPTNKAVAAQVTMISREQKIIQQRLDIALARIAKVTAELTCLERYKEFKSRDETYSCSETDLTADEFTRNLEQTKLDISGDRTGAGLMTLPIGLYKAADKDTSDMLTTCRQLPIIEENDRTSCFESLDELDSNQALFSAAITALQKAQTSLLQAVQILNSWPGTTAAPTWSISERKNHISTVTVSAQEVISKATTTLATVKIDWQTTRWVVSTGIGFSNLASRSYTNAPIIVNGQPSLDSSGKNLTVVTESDTKPSIIFPEALLSFRINSLSHFHWESKCPNGCAFLISGGIGLNLSTNSANFDAGPSFQFGSVLFTPAVHFGRETVLSNGVTVGSQLGSNPPSPLPIQEKWRIKFGFLLTYTLPIP